MTRQGLLVAGLILGTILVSCSSKQLTTEQIQEEQMSATSWISRGYTWNKAGKTENAIKDYTEAIRLDPSEDLAYYFRGQAWKTIGDLGKAIDDYTEAINLKPKNPQYHDVRAQVWAEKGDIDRAIQDYSNAIKLDPNNTYRYIQRGQLWIAKGDIDNAIEDHNEVTRIDPKFDPGILMAGALYAIGADFEKQISIYHKITQRTPENFYIHNEIAWLMATCPDDRYRDGKKAVECATRACELTDWKRPGFIDTLAAAYAESGDYPNAMRWQEKSLELATDDEKKNGAERLELYRAHKPCRVIPKNPI